MRYDKSCPTTRFLLAQSVLISHKAYTEMNTFYAGKFSQIRE